MLSWLQQCKQLWITYGGQPLDQGLDEIGCALQLFVTCMGLDDVQACFWGLLSLEPVNVPPLEMAEVPPWVMVKVLPLVQLALMLLELGVVAVRVGKGAASVAKWVVERLNWWSNF